MKFFTLLSFLSLTVLGALHSDNMIRAAIDIGMGGPKLHIAEVDLKTRKIIRTLHVQRYFVNFYEAPSQSADRQLHQAVMKQGLQAFKEAVVKAKEFKAEKIVAIGTAAFRFAANGKELADLIHQETAIPVHIVDQNLEGTLAFEAVLAQMDVDAEHLIVWDMGGGSIQFVLKKPDGSLSVHCEHHGVGAFTDFIIEKIQWRNILKHRTPNPMSADDIVLATAHAQHLFSQTVDAAFKDKIRESKTIVVGVGNAFGYGIAPKMKGKLPFTMEDLAQVVQNLAGKTDEDLGGGDYAFCEGSNAILALGFMRGLGIQKLHILKVNNADGALLHEPFWK